MNAIKIRTGLACLLVAGFATGNAFAMDAAAMEKHNEDKQQRQEQRHERQDNGRHDPHYADNPAPPHQDNGRHDPHYANNPAPTHQDNGRHDPHYANNPAPPPPAPGGQHNPGYNGDSHSPGNNGNGNHVVYGPPRGPQGPNYHGPGSNIVPPPRGQHSGHDYGHGPGYARPPYMVPSLPVGYHRHYWNGNPYYYGGGHWYRPYGSSYVVARAPYGMFVASLPYYSSFWYGNARYYYSDGIYYNYAPARSGYVVTQSPYQDERSDEVAASDDEMYIYPAQGQSEQQQADDKYECHLWAVSQAQFDPTSSDFNAQLRADYDRAMGACLTGRGYTVR